MKIVGLMSGTSADGIDSALVDVRGKGHHPKIRLLGFETFSYPVGVQKRILHAALSGTVDEICHLNFYLGELFSDAVLRLLRKNGYEPNKVRLIGSHGQTVHHLSKGIPEGKRTIASTLQIGEPSVIAERTGITTVADFRPRDMAAGGEGAPLAPLFHQTLLGHSKKTRLVVNVGGISNVTFLPSGTKEEDVLAFDVGPGNMLLDGYIGFCSHGKKRMDKNGTLARKGQVNSKLLGWLTRHPFLRQRPPKSCGRETFGLPYLEKLIQKAKTLHLSHSDILATLTVFSVYGIASCLQWLPQKGRGLQEVIVGGGGVMNRTFMLYLRKIFSPLPVQTYEDYGFHSRAVEAMAFAFLAFLTHEGIPNNLPSVTGAKRRVIMGKIVKGSPFK
ncbi:MAG TPA: anhydro-N-acetylmuramic acid kinase [Nitrospiria bacterium]|jgi:anhydro-N-acetylmuramic acid kinase